MSAPKQSLFNLTLMVIHETERRVLTFQSFGANPDKFIRNIMLPLPFIQFGISELFQPISKLVYMLIGLLILTTVILSNPEISEQNKGNIVSASFFVPIFLVVFATPSTFAFDSIKNEQIQSLADYIYALGIDSKEKLEAFEENLSIIADRTYARTKTLQWFVATLWALFLYGFNQVHNIALKIVPEQITKIISDSIMTFIIYGVVSFFSVLLIFGHKKASDAVFRRLYFAIQELKFRAVVV